MKCGLCGLNSHNEFSENCSFNFAKWALLHQTHTRLNENDNRTNIRKYLKFVEKKQSGARQIDKIDKHIHCLTCDNVSPENTALIHLLQIIRDKVLEYESDDSSTSSKE